MIVCYKRLYSYTKRGKYGDRYLKIKAFFAFNAHAVFGCTQ